jgi:hypothetical protein
MTQGLPDSTYLRTCLDKLTRQLRSLGGSDPLLWAAMCSVESAALLLSAYERRCLDSREDSHTALLEAMGSARAAVGAVTYAAQFYSGRPRDPADFVSENNGD